VVLVRGLQYLAVTGGISSDGTERLQRVADTALGIFSRSHLYCDRFESAIAACKHVAASVTGSAAMWAEAFYSTADSGDELLLL
jgi:hypothetical protein